MPGACLVAPPPREEFGLGFLAKYVIWKGYDVPCMTKYVRSVCILGKPHISNLHRVPHLFANKFHADYHADAYDIMEKWYFGKVRNEHLHGDYSVNGFDPTVYSQLTCSRNHL